MNTADFQRAGLYDPDAENANDRLALLEFLAANGVTLEQMIDADARGTLATAASDQNVLRRSELISLRELARRAGMASFMTDLERPLTEGKATELEVAQAMMAGSLAAAGVPMVLETVREETIKATDDYRFDPAGRRMLKGFEEPVEVFSLTRPV
jgi:hypothetical protein